MNPDDPKLTAYVLDELEPAERAEIEQLLRDDPAALAEINASSAFAARLRREFQAEITASLTPDQRGEVLAAATPGSATLMDAAPEKITPMPRRWIRPFALAASMAVVAGASYVALRLSWDAGSRRSFAAVQDNERSAGAAYAPALEKQLAQLAEEPVSRALPAAQPSDPGVSLAMTESPIAENSLVVDQPSAGKPVELGLKLKVGNLAVAGQPALPGVDKSKAELKADAEGFYEKGRYDLALKRTEQIINIEPYDTEARKMQEKINQAIDDSAVPSYNETRSRLTVRDELASAPRPRAKQVADTGAAGPNRADGLSLGTAPNTPSDASGLGRETPAEADLAAVQIDIAGAMASTASGVAPSPTSSPAPSPSGSLASNQNAIDTLSFATAGGAPLTGPAPAADAAKAMTSSAAPADGTETWASQPGSIRGFSGRASSASSGDPSARPTTLALSKHPARGEAPKAAAPAPQQITQGGPVPYYRGRGIEESGVSSFGAEGVALQDSRTAEYRSVPQPEPAKRLTLVQRVPTESSTEAYDAITDNAFLSVRDNPLSTFSIDVDTASYSNVRRFLNQQQLPPKGAVRIEELINYFDYEYPQPEGDAPFSATMEVATCPWKPEHRLVRIGLKGRELAHDKRPPSNLVFLVDVSGSMEPENKLPLVKKSLRLLVDQLSDNDTVSIAVYAGASGCVLDPTNKKSEIRAALDKLESGGSTNGASGIRLAYELAEKSFIKEGANRVILLTDGDFNVGITNQSELVELIEKKAKSGVFLTVLGFGMGNLKDSTLEKLADKGNGNYGYIDTLLEGKKMLVDQMSGTLVTIAKDVKIQVEFNPAQVAGYRLIGYENRVLKKEDFNDDTKDAGEIGAGHTVTALYEVVPANAKLPGLPGVDPLKYQGGARAGERVATQRGAEDAQAKDDPAGRVSSDQAPSPAAKAASTEMLTLKLRYKAPQGDTSKLLEFPLTDDGKSYERSSKDFRFAAAVASFGMLLRDSPHKGAANWSSTLELAAEGKGADRSGYRAEFVGLVERAKAASSR
ncbi:MAG: hypothetical protein JWQ44_2370 [Chthoniobacter sp.]|nr:hypothetical protein [Chthoniobacter sp.]